MSFISGFFKGVSGRSIFDDLPVVAEKLKKHGQEHVADMERTAETPEQRQARLYRGEQLLQSFADRLTQSYAPSARIAAGELPALPAVDDAASMEELIVLVAMMRTRQMDGHMDTLRERIRERAHELAVSTNALIFARAAQAFMADKSEKTSMQDAVQAGRFVLDGIFRGSAADFARAKYAPTAADKQAKAEQVLDGKQTFDATALIPWLDAKMPGWRDQLPADIRCQNLFPADVWNVLETKIDAYVENIAKDIEGLLHDLRTLNGQYSQVMQKAVKNMAGQGGSQAA